MNREARVGAVLPRLHAQEAPIRRETPGMRHLSRALRYRTVLSVCMPTCGHPSPRGVNRTLSRRLFGAPGRSDGPVRSSDAAGRSPTDHDAYSMHTWARAPHAIRPFRDQVGLFAGVAIDRILSPRTVRTTPRLAPDRS